MSNLFRLIMLLSLTAAMSLARAQSAPLEGTYLYEPNGSADINAAIEAAVAKMNFIKRPIARSRLKKTNPVYQSIAIERTEAQVIVEYNGRLPLRMPADGSVVKWQRDDDEVFDVFAKSQAGSLTQTFKAKDGERKNAFRLSPDGGKLLLEVTLSSGQLPAPITYTLAYRRQ